MGKCPHCGSRNIRRRYRQHRRYKWRCRRCNRVFRRPKSGILPWLGVAVLVAAAAAFFAVQQGMIAPPPAVYPIEEQIGRAAEAVSTSVADNAPKVQATIETNVRSAVSTVSTAISATATPISTVTSTSAPLAIPAVTHTPTDIPPPHLRHIYEKRYMLELINAERKKAGVPPVELGDNIAAQLHAESALDNCFSSHWGIDGLKPYMRYSLAGGYQSNGENGHGSDYCIKSSDGYTAIHNIEREIADAMNGWMDSSGTSQKHSRQASQKGEHRRRLGQV